MLLYALFLADIEVVCSRTYVRIALLLLTHHGVRFFSAWRALSFSFLSWCGTGSPGAKPSGPPRRRRSLESAASPTRLTGRAASATVGLTGGRAGHFGAKQRDQSRARSPAPFTGDRDGEVDGTSRASSASSRRGSARRRSGRRGTGSSSEDGSGAVAPELEGLPGRWRSGSGALDGRPRAGSITSMSSRISSEGSDTRISSRPRLSSIGHADGPAMVDRAQSARVPSDAAETTPSSRPRRSSIGRADTLDSVANSHVTHGGPSPASPTSHSAPQVSVHEDASAPLQAARSSTLPAAVSSTFDLLREDPSPRKDRGNVYSRNNCVCFASVCVCNSGRSKGGGSDGSNAQHTRTAPPSLLSEGLAEAHRIRAANASPPSHSINSERSNQSSHSLRASSSFGELLHLADPQSTNAPDLRASLRPVSPATRSRRSSSFTGSGLGASPSNSRAKLGTSPPSHSAHRSARRLTRARSDQGATRRSRGEGGAKKPAVTRWVSGAEDEV